MLKFFFNHYKIKRKLDRKIGTVRNAVKILAPEDDKSNRDFSWHGRKANPFFIKGTPIKWLKIKIAAIFFSLATVFLLLLYHPFFRISEVNISGNQRIQKNEFQKTIEGIISYKKWHLLPQNSFIFVNVDELRDILLRRFPIASIVAQKSFPNILSITVEEKIASMIYDNGYQFSYIDNEGNVIEIVRNVMDSEWQKTVKISTSTNEIGDVVTSTEIISKIHKPDIRQLQSQFGHYPVVYDEAGKDEGVNESVISKKNSENILQWTNLLKSRSDISVSYFVINSEMGDMSVKTKDGWEIRAKLDKPANEQFENLLLLLRTKINSRSNLSYIDLRYDGRFYWQ